MISSVGPRAGQHKTVTSGLLLPFKHMKYQRNDGGRKAAGYKGITGDCVCRAIAIGTGQPYQTVYEDRKSVV